MFAKNLKDLLLAAPAGTRTTLGLDPGFRTGVKVAVVDGTGKVVDTCAIYPHQPQKQVGCGQGHARGAGRPPRSRADRRRQRHGVARDRRAGSRTHRRHPGRGRRAPAKAMVSEAGASVYSASAYAAHELPDLDVTLRGAVSIARRLQDPLAELVKIEPKSIGVGQYQHDVTPGTLARSLDAVVEDAVNAVGVDLNTASVPLLARVSGVTESLAEAIVAHREQTGPFRNRKALLKVPRLGPKAFEQCAGFLRINGGDDPLDASGVHPEAYPVVRRILDRSGVTLAELIGDERSLRSLQPADFADDRFGIPTVTDILAELEKPGRDPRPAFSTATFAAGVEKVADLEGRHGPRGRGDQRRGVRRVRRRRRASGRPGARLGDGRPLRVRPARGGAVRAGGAGQGARRRRRPPAHRVESAFERHTAAGSGQAFRSGAGDATKAESRQGFWASGVESSHGINSRCLA